MAEEKKPADKSRRILQISDLHFGDHDPNAWTETVKLVESLAIECRLDYIVVTGDLQNHLFSDIPGAKAALTEIEKHCDRLLVIPGNHDYLVYGLLDRPLIFGSLPLISLATFFMPILAFVTVPYAILATCYLFFPQYIFRRNYKKWWQGASVTLDEERGLLFAQLDTNSIWSSWARGQMGARQLNWLASELAALKSSKEKSSAYEKSVKIALMHHHPLPIVRQEKPMGIVPGRKVEEMLMLDDASETLRTLADSGFDVVLHGHKHKSAASRLVTEMEKGGVKRQMLVVACGTSCLKNEAPFSANLLTILPTRHVVLERFFTEDPVIKGYEPIEPMLVPTRLIEVAAADAGYRAARSQCSFRIDEDGDSHYVAHVSGLEPTHHTRKTLDPIIVQQPCGTLHDPKFTSDQLEVLTKSATNTGIEYEFGPWKCEPGQKAEYHFSYWTLGMWVLNVDQKRLVYGQKSHGRTGCYVRVLWPTASLEISIQLPECCRPEKPKLKFYTLKEKTAVPQLARILESGLLWSPERNFIGVKLNNPPLGLYEVTWDLPLGPVETIADPKAHSMATDAWETLREDLLAMDGPNPSPKACVFAEDIRTIMDMVSPMLAGALGDPSSDPGRFEVSLMVYDPTTDGASIKPGLRVVSHNRNQESSIKNPRLPVGTGMAGRACKMGKPLVYNPNIRPTDKPIPYMRLAGQRQHEVLYSLPIPSATAPSLWTGVVLNIGAYKNGGPLLPDSNRDWNALVLKIGAEVPTIRRLIAEAWAKSSGKSFAG